MFYLLTFSWAAVTISLSSVNQLSKPHTRVLKIVAITLSYAYFAFRIILLAKATTFGSDPECNRKAIAAFFFVSFPAIHGGRALGFLTFISLIMFYTMLTIRDFTPPRFLSIIKYPIAVPDPQMEAEFQSSGSLTRRPDPIRQVSLK